MIVRQLYQEGKKNNQVPAVSEIQKLIQVVAIIIVFICLFGFFIKIVFF
jgi:hypothetical protein